MRDVVLPMAALATMPAKWLQRFRQRAAIETIWDLRRHAPPVRHGLMAAFCHERQHEIVDGLIDLLMQIQDFRYSLANVYPYIINKLSVDQIV